MLKPRVQHKATQDHADEGNQHSLRQAYLHQHSRPGSVGNESFDLAHAGNVFSGGRSGGYITSHLRIRILSFLQQCPVSALSLNARRSLTEAAYQPYCTVQLASGLAVLPRRSQINRLQRPSPGKHRCVSMQRTLDTKMASCREVNKRCCIVQLCYPAWTLSAAYSSLSQKQRQPRWCWCCIAGVSQVLRVCRHQAWTLRVCHRTWSTALWRLLEQRDRLRGSISCKAASHRKRQRALIRARNHVSGIHAQASSFSAAGCRMKQLEPGLTIRTAALGVDHCAPLLTFRNYMPGPPNCHTLEQALYVAGDAVVSTLWRRWPHQAVWRLRGLISCQLSKSLQLIPHLRVAAQSAFMLHKLVLTGVGLV